MGNNKVLIDCLVCMRCSLSCINVRLIVMVIHTNNFFLLFLGEENTWHGELDLVSGDEPKNPCKSYSCVNVATAVDISGDTGSDTNAGGDQSSKINDSNSSPGNHTNIEFKETVPNDIVQMISQAIVFGFTEYNRHKDYSPYIPTVCIDKQRFLIFIYNPVQDTLMASFSSLRFFPFKSHLEIFALWVVLNHRLFFRKQIDIKEIPCGFQTQVEVEPYKHLSKYKSIVKSHWDGITFPDFHASILYCHPKKRKVPFTE